MVVNHSFENDTELEYPSVVANKIKPEEIIKEGDLSVLTFTFSLFAILFALMMAYYCGLEFYRRYLERVPGGPIAEELELQQLGPQQENQENLRFRAARNTDTLLDDETPAGASGETAAEVHTKSKKTDKTKKSAKAKQSEKVTEKKKKISGEKKSKDVGPSNAESSASNHSD